MAPVRMLLAAAILALASPAVAAPAPAVQAPATTPAAESRHQWTVFQRQIAEFKQARSRTAIDERARMSTVSWNGYKPTWPEMVAQTHRQASLIFESDRDPVDVALRRTEALLGRVAELPRAPDLAESRRALAALGAEARGIPPGDAARQALFDRLAALRRRIALAKPLLDFSSILFIKRSFCEKAETAGDHMVPQFWGRNGMPQGKAGGLFVLENAFAAEPALRDVLTGSVCRNGRFQGSRLPPGGFLSPELSFDGKHVLFAYCEKGGPQPYATPWPLSEDFWLCVYDADAAASRGVDNRFGIYLADAFGNKELLYRDAGTSCLSPIPVAARPCPPAIPSPLPDAAPEPAARTAPTATVSVMNVYDSRRAWPEGTRIRALRIVQVLPRPTSMPDRKRPMIGYATDNGARVVLGTVPVDSDGSAHFIAPAGKPLYFQALDGRGLAVQSMRSDTYFQAGEVHACLGCHEDRHRSPPARSQAPLALRRAPSSIEPEPDGSNPLSFPRLVQPVLDARCVACHAKSPKSPDLSAGPWEKNQHQWVTSYGNLRRYAFYYDSGGGGGWNRWVDSITIPGRFGALASPLFQLLDKGHYDVKLSPSELRRITLWLDANAPFFGSYENTVAQARGEVVRPKLE